MIFLFAQYSFVHIIKAVHPFLESKPYDYFIDRPN